MRNCRFIFCLFTVLIYSPLHSQDYLPPEVLSVENGLSSWQVNCLISDRYGYLWAGTSRGLNRFDGYHFRHFFTTADVTIAPGMQFIKTIRNDRDGNLWILTDAGIVQYDSKSGEITKYPVSSFDAVYNPESSLVDICPSPDGTLWVLTDRSLTMLSGDQVINTYLIPGELLLNGALPTCVVADQGGNIWIGTSSGLLLFSSQQKLFKELVRKVSQGLLSDIQVNCLFMDHENYLWIGTRNGLNRFDPVDFAFSQYFPGGSQHSQSNNRVLGISSAEPGVLVLATGAGIVKFNTSSQEFENVYLSPDQSIRSVAVDSTGIIWGGTNQGILKIRKSKLSVQNYTSGSKTPRLAKDYILTLERGLNNELFVGYKNAGYSVINMNNLTGSQFSAIDESSVVHFYPFRQQDYLILSEHDIEVFTPDRKGRKSLFSMYSFLKKDLVEKVRLNCLFYDGAHAIWLGTSDGIQRIQLDSGKHVSKQTLGFENQQVPLGKVYDIKQDPFGNIWLGTENGLTFYNPVKGSYNRYTPYDINLLNTERKAVYTIVPVKSGVFWLGTSGGAYQFDATTREFSAVSDDPEIMSSSIRALAADRYGNLWIGAETGLFYYIRSSNKVRSYDLKDGLLNDTYTSICTGSDDLVFLAGNSGLSVIHLSDVIESGRTHEVVITGIRYIENDPKNQDLYYQVSDTITLPWQRKPIQIDFAVLDLSRPENNHFKYGFGKKGKTLSWCQLGTDNSVILDHLAPGKYVFNVVGSDSDMNWNNKGTSLVIIIEAPYWRSKIGMAVMLLAGLFLFFMFFRFWIRQFFNLSRENQEREMFARQIMLQKEELTLKNKSITDSINYAKRIQTAMLPPYKLFKSFFPSSFILFMPKDIVSGDFYWVHKISNKIFISAVDCTGHGVPGAFMSIIGFELFRKITNIEGLTRPSDILNRVNDDFHEIFKDVDNVVLRDGMDVAFCSIDKKDMILEFAGAFNPLYLIRDNKITEVKGDRFAIGLDETNFREQTFKNHIIPLQKGDLIYIFSDGFADQFGGPDGKKYKYRRFRHLLLNLHQLPPEKQHEILENNVMEWRGEQDQVDDILVIGIKVDF